MRDGVRPRSSGCLNIEFLEDLREQRAIVTVEKGNGKIVLGDLPKIAADRIKQDVGVEKVQRSRSPAMYVIAHQPIGSAEAANACTKLPLFLFQPLRFGLT